MISRRRALLIMGGAAVFPSSAAPKPTAQQWNGIALGAEAQIILDHPDAATLIPRAVLEISRLEDIFSLYRKDSQVSKLNAQGYLKQPAFELVELLSICKRIHSQTLGAFDPTIQSLWSLYAREISGGNTPSDNQIEDTRALVGLENIRYSTDEIRLTKTGMALTFNGIAQGFIADKVSDLLRSFGVKNTLINTGEIQAIGNAANGLAWPITAQGKSVPLSEMAIATSANMGTVLDVNDSIGHIIDPRTGRPSADGKTVSVTDRSAAIADGLSTGFCLLNSQQIERQKNGNRVLIS